MRWRRLALPLIAGALALGSGSAEPQPAVRQDPFAFLSPTIGISPDDRARLNRRQVLVKMLPGKGQVAVFVATRLQATPEALVVWTHAIAELKRSKHVLAIGRVSDPPALADFDGLSLDERDLEAIRKCSLSKCGLRISGAEIEALARVRASAGQNWRDAVQREFRRLMLERVTQYRTGGLAALPAAADRKDREPPAGALAEVLNDSPYLSQVPALTGWLRDYPRAAAGVESFLYWSKESYGEAKPVVGLTHVGILRPDAARGLPLVIVAGKQIFATHYVEASVGLTMVLRDPGDGAVYLAYLNRSRLDLLKGVFGGLIGRIVRGRIERQAPEIIGQLRQRVESGVPRAP